MASDLVSFYPGHSLGRFVLGASLYETLTIIKADKVCYKKIDLHFEKQRPLDRQLIVDLPLNGVRLRFDGPDQRLRLIEVMNFNKAKVAYKGNELMKSLSGNEAGPTFRRIYQIFGATYPGEYRAPIDGNRFGHYVLSWTGLSFIFEIQHSMWSAGKDHVAVLGSEAARPAKTMALFEGNSWAEVRRHLFIRQPIGPRMSAIASRPKDNLPRELEIARLRGEGRIEFLRRPPGLPFWIVINQTTPQDLITELGPPDANHRRDLNSIPQEQPGHRRTGSSSHPMANGRVGLGSQPSSYSSTGTDTYDVDFDSGDAEEDAAEKATRELFWCYFNHGMDILIGPPKQNLNGNQHREGLTPLAASSRLVVTKVIIHGNVPGSYAFNRHRRLRWKLALPNTEYAGNLTSESEFNKVLKPALMHMFQGVWPDSQMGKGKVINRTWGTGPSDSSFFLPDAGEDLVEGGSSEQWLGNTRLYTFPGFSFEVVDSGAVSALTVN